MRLVSEEEHARRRAARDATNTDIEAAKMLGMPNVAYRSWMISQSLRSKTKKVCEHCGGETRAAGMRNGKETIDWHSKEGAILAEYQRLKSIGLTSTTKRSIYYTLGQRGDVPLTPNGYTGVLDCILRLQRCEPQRIEWGFFDEALTDFVEIRNGASSAQTLATSEINWALSARERALLAWTGYALPRWFGQKTLVELWVEKIGLVPITKLWTQGLDITIRACRGKALWEFGYAALSHIAEQLQLENFDEAVILYAGDCDPSGLSIPVQLEREIIPHFTKFLGIEKPVEVVHIGLHTDQIKEFHLPPDPKPEHAQKAQHDPGWKAFRQRYPGKLQLTELDAFYSSPDEAEDARRKEWFRSQVEERFSVATYRLSRVEESDRQAEIKRLIEEGLGDEEPSNTVEVR